MPLAGTLVEGRYRLVRPVGHGASSVVYFAVGVDGLPYAVKIFPPELEARAQREMTSAGRLSHPRLGQVMQRVNVEGQPALILSFARGRVLFERYSARPALAHERKAYLLTLAHVLEALTYMHDNGIIHRDLKPENIIVDTDGSAKLVDFDLSGPNREAFGTALRIGTAAFLSPEAARGEPLSTESDLYGVGILLYWGLHGELPLADADVRVTRDPLESLRVALMQPSRSERLSDAREARRRLLELAALPY
ncbi:serine/threonine-protein kinase [Deinococcus yavapaiensis]|uniref:Protein kinase-like protein n=1 Tax=Deinococcus yavapaiensis KR-236 TaxID=694435 RepID=A0A318SD42_9DEIO|nr:serine/threonine-protein kinase [Deinococcus yavapaiensis]PYE55314.1 protein kinase-like protein [Deinococcus yavapaiensis KR-236]